MKILITGATGLIGSHIVAQCLAKGYEINYLTTSKDKLEQKKNYKGFYWNPKDGIIDEKAINDVDAIIHLAGANIAQRWTSSYKETILKSRTETAALLFKALKKSDESVKQIVSASGVSIYPSSLTDFYTEEEERIADSFLGNVVVEWEKAVDEFRTIGIDVAKLRIGLVLSNEDGALPKLAKPIKYGLGAPLGSGKQWQSWIHIDDLASMFVHAVENELEGVYNAVTSKPQTNEEITKIIANLYNTRIRLPNIPKFALRLLLGEMADVVLDSQMVSNEKIATTGFKYKYHHLKPALRNLLKN